VYFEWNSQKEALNIEKHGVDFSGVAAAFDDPRRIFIRFPGLTRTEVRWQCVGWDGHGILTVRFTLRPGGVRVIGAGYWRRQKKIYEEKNNLQG